MTTYARYRWKRCKSLCEMGLCLWLFVVKTARQGHCVQGSREEVFLDAFDDN